MAEATVGDLQAAARRWLSDGRYSLEVLPYPPYEASTESADRSEMPRPGEAAAPAFPEMHTTTLDNGMRLIVAERHEVPVINFNLLIDAGYAADQFGLPGPP